MVPSLSNQSVESKGGNSVLEKREVGIVRKGRVFVHCDRFFLHGMRRSYVDGFMCQRKHLLMSRERFPILIRRSQTETFVFCGNAFLESFEKDFLQSGGFTMSKLMQVVSASVGVLPQSGY